MTYGLIEGIVQNPFTLMSCSQFLFMIFWIAISRKRDTVTPRGRLNPTTATAPHGPRLHPQAKKQEVVRRLHGEELHRQNPGAHR